MSALTAEAARAAADAYEAANGDGWKGSWWLRKEADRIEAAEKTPAMTPGQVLAETMCYDNWLRWSDATRSSYENYAAAVIAHHVGPDRIVVDKYLVEQAWETIDNAGRSVLADRLREALS